MERLQGSFHTKEDKDRKIKSTIELLPNGSFILEAEEAFSKNNCVLEETLFGELDDKMYATLIKPYYRKKFWGGMGKPSKSILSSSVLVISNQYVESFDNVKLTEATLEIDSASKWFYSSRINEERIYKEQFKKTVSLELDDYEILINHAVNEKVTLLIKVKKSCSLRDIQEIIYKILTFISFSIGHCVQQNNLKVTDIENNEYKLIDNPSFSADGGKSSQSAIFLYNHDNINVLFSKWSNFSDDMGVLLRLYFLPMLSKMDLSVKFIVRTQLAEALAKKMIENNDLNFRSCINEIITASNYTKLIQKAENKVGIDKFCGQVTDTRNYFTHYSDKSKSKALDGNDLFMMCLKLELLLDLFIYNYIGATEENFNDIYENVIEDRYNRELKLKPYC